MRRVLLLITSVLLITGGAWYFLSLRGNKVTSTNDTSDQTTKENSLPKLSFNTPSTESVLDSQVSLEQKYVELITYGIQQQSAENYMSAYDYFVAAASVGGITLTQKYGAYYSAYQAALVLKDSDKAENAKKAISVDEFTKLDSSTYQEGEAGE